MTSSPSIPDTLTRRERELIAHALWIMIMFDQNLSDDDTQMARRLMATIKPPASMPDDGS